MTCSRHCKAHPLSDVPAQFLEALRTGADDSEIAVRRHALLTKAAPELNPGDRRQQDSVTMHRA